MKYITSLVALAFCLLVGCAKEKEAAAPNKAEVRVAADFGIIEVSDGLETIHDLGGGKTCRMKSNFEKDGTVVLEMKIEENGTLLTSPRIKTPFDMPVKIAVGNIEVSFTPRKKP